jgi:CHAT domain-containing protein
MIEVTERVLGKEHPYRAKGLSWAACLHQRLGHWDRAQSIAREAWQIALDNFRENHSVLAERAMFDLAENLSSFSSRYLTILLADAAASSADATARVVFSTKGRVTDAIIARQQKWEEDDSLTAHLAESLRDARFSLSRLYTDGPGKDSMQVYRHKLDSATREREKLETELASRSSRFAQEGELWDVDAHQVSTSMPAGSQFVEFMRYYRRQGLKVGDDEPQYLAVVLKAGESPSAFPLGPAAGIDTAIRYYRQQFRDPQNLDPTAYGAASENLYGLVWRPFAALLEGATTVFVAPDGDLNLVSFAGLIDDDHKYLIENYPIHYVSTGRDLIRLQDETPSGNGLLAMGDPDFDMTSGASTVSAVGLALLTSLNLRSSCEELNKLHVGSLPGTRTEVESVATSWRSTGAAAATYFGSDATEENFKRNAPGKRVIHLATHGFYISDACQTELNTRSALGMQESGNVGENPLLLSGLLLAGANKHGEGANEAKREDGIVTAEEVAGMDLRGTDLVVLSACETGLGTVKSGEGVYGLRRAFQMAGARTVISALWPIDDKATAEFMSQLFSAQDETLPQTMQRIARKRLSSLRAQGKSDHPFFWAAFVATGDWKTR